MGFTEAINCKHNCNCLNKEDKNNNKCWYTEYVDTADSYDKQKCLDKCLCYKNSINEEIDLLRPRCSDDIIKVSAL